MPTKKRLNPATEKTHEKYKFKKNPPNLKIKRMPKMKKLLNKLEPPSTSNAAVALPSAAPPPSSSDKPQLNSLIGKTYKLEKGTLATIEEIIAEGGFGIVFLAKFNNTLGALKRIVVNNETDLNVAKREVTIMSTLGHQSPYILPCLDSLIQKIDSDVTEILSLTPFCKSNLLTVLQTSQANKTPLKEIDVLKILSDVVQGVARLHHCTTPIIHRDLKIENILEQQINGKSRYVLCDFGSATGKFWDPEIHSINSISEELEKYTTLAYRAPEMVDLYSNRGPIGTKSDIWAIGIATYKMLYYTTPYGESVLAIQSGKLDFPSSPLYSKQMQLLIQYMLISDQKSRPDIYQVSELVHSMLAIPNPVQNLNSTTPWSFEDIEHYKPVAIETISKIGVVPAPVPIVLETSVTPRSRPKPGIANLQPAVAVPAAAAQSDIIIPPPKSPKIPRKIEEIPAVSAPAPELVPAAASPRLSEPINSWNPFECAEPSSPTVTTDDPFALAPFNYFNYQPVEEMENINQDMFGSEPFSNPFIDFNDINISQNVGVTNQSFEH